MDKGSLENTMKPMNFGLSLIYFGIPAIWFVFCFHVIMPFLNKIGTLPAYSYFISMGFAITIIIIVSLVFYGLEKNTWKWENFSNRYRIKKMNKNDWIIFLVVFSIAMVIYFFVFPLLNSYIIGSGIMPIPESIPDWLNPYVTENAEQIFDQAFGGLKGNWFAVIAFVIVLILNIVGEELWWRGYILPRQELYFGKNTWIVHGLLWLFFHIFKYWDIPNLLIMCLLYSYMAYRTKNTTTVVLVHFIINGIQIILMIGLIK